MEAFLKTTHRAASKEEILNSGTTVASIFFGKVFGHEAQKALTVFVALRCVEVFPISSQLLKNGW